jgi:hypothetical protein
MKDDPKHEAIMIRVAERLGRYHAESGIEPKWDWMTQARRDAYKKSYYESKVPWL